MNATPSSSSPASLQDQQARRARQKRTLTLLALGLIAGGIIVLTLLPRLPLPLRLLTGLGDVFIGLVLLVAVRQQREPTRSEQDKP